MVRSTDPAGPSLGAGIPRPPSRFLRPVTWQTVVFLAYATLLAAGPGWAAQALWGAGADAALWRVACTVGLVVLSGYGYFLLGITAHEGYHFTLHRHPATSALLGVLFSAVLPGFIGTGFAYSHWQHHRHTNQPQDPDRLQFSRFRGFWSRLLLARLSSTANYRRIALRIVRGHTAHDADAPQLPAATLRWLCAVNLGWHVVLMALVLWALVLQPRLVLLAYLLPLAVTVMISGLNPYQEHCETGHTVSDRARTRTAWLLTLLMGGTNYHMEHHLYPRIPCWRLPALHRWLRETPWYQQHEVVVAHGLAAAFSPRILSRAAAYGARSEAGPRIC